MAFKPLPIGVDDFKDLIENGYYYVDKTLMIRDLLKYKGKVKLFTRPRRFGKTLNMSMLKYFFEDTGNAAENAVSRKLFAGTKIMEAGEEYTARMSASPVIMITLKSMKQAGFQQAFLMAKRELAQEYYRHRNIVSSLVSAEEQKRYQNMLDAVGGIDEYLDSLRFLSDCLYRHYGKKVIILIDEYDVPLENAYYQGFYDDAVGFIRSIFESALKTNPGLDFAVVTGCLRISKESIFTGLNNLEIVSILNAYYAEYFGFLEAEVEEMLAFYGREAFLGEARKWYDGYRFGDTEVYNPWSVIKYVKQVYRNPEAFPEPFWSNTSSNSIVRDLIEHADMAGRDVIETLIQGGTIEIPIHEDVTYGDVYKNADNLWNFLFFTGYLKVINKRKEDIQTIAELAIPNLEIRYIYENAIIYWFEDRIKGKSFKPLHQALEQGDETAISNLISDELFETISYYDGSSEGFYHGFMTGLLRGIADYSVESNREAGNGRPDVILRYKRIRGAAIVLEFKVAKTADEIGSKLGEAETQMISRNYMKALKGEGYQNVFGYAMVFYRKECVVRLVKEMA